MRGNAAKPMQNAATFVPQDEVNRLVTLATSLRTEQPIFSVDSYLI